MGAGVKLIESEVDLNENVRTARDSSRKMMANPSWSKHQSGDVVLAQYL